MQIFVFSKGLKQPWWKGHLIPQVDCNLQVENLCFRGTLTNIRYISLWPECVCLCAMYICVTYRVQKRMSDSLKLDFQVDGEELLCVLRIKPLSSVKAASALNCWVISLASFILPIIIKNPRFPLSNYHLAPFSVSVIFRFLDWGNFFSEGKVDESQGG